MQSNHQEQGQTVQLTRRQFLQMLGLSATAAWLAACAPVRSNPIPLSSPFPAHPILPSPQPAATTTPSNAEGLALADFLRLSAALTGVAELNPQVGRVYLESLQASGEFDVTLTELYRQAGFGATSSPSLAELEANGLFDQASTRKLADKIIEYWYTGVYQTAAGEQAVATFVDALTWRTLHFTKPPTICGAPDFWAEPPNYLDG